MAIGTRNQPEKELDSKLKPKSFQRISRKREKIMQNRKVRRIARRDPEAPPLPKYKGYDW